MKKLISLFLPVLFITTQTNAQSIKDATPRGFVNPITYDKTAMKSWSVGNYIYASTRKEYNEMGLDNERTFEIMESNNKSAFRKLVDAEYDDLLESVIIKNCKVGECTYSKIYTSYIGEVKKKKE